eukprot:XP_011607082.1 PREDICTED: F-box only protein 46-like [Takifugu rubripes]
MDRDTFSHIRLWCPRPFGTYSQNKARSPGSAGTGGGGAGTGSPSLCKAEPSPDARRTVERAEDGAVVMGVQEKNGKEADVGSENTPPEPKLVSSSLPATPAPVSSGAPSSAPSSPQMEDGRVLLDTWYVIKPGNTKEKIAFFVAHQFSGAEQPRPSAMKCMFMSCGGGGNQAAARAKEKITCDLYQLVSPSSRDPGSLLLAATTPAPKPEGELHHPDRQACGTPDAGQELPVGEKKALGVGRERVTGFHVEVVVTGAVDQCVFYGKDSTENVQEETVCFAMANGGGGVGSSADPSSDDPPPGQLFFLQPSRGAEEDGAGSMCSLDCGSSGPGAAVGAGAGEQASRPDSPGAGEDCSDPSLCRLYRHVSHDFLEIRFQIQRLLEPRQYMLLMPDHIMVNIFSYLPTRSLAALKCTCHYFKMLIEMYGVRAVDSLWNQDPLYRDDPCKQCKRQYEHGDVSLCRWHPKPYHHDLPYGRSYWMCCRRTDKDTPGCRVGLHDNNWVQQPADGSQPLRTKREDRREEAR